MVLHILHLHCILLIKYLLLIKHVMRRVGGRWVGVVKEILGGEM